MKTITKLAWSNNRKNRARCVLIVLSIFLTTVLLSAIATFGYGQIRFQRVNAEEFYGSYYGTYANVNEQQIAEMQKRSEFDRIGRAASVGEIENTRDISMVWMDGETMQLANMEKQLQEGAFPQQENEIAGQKEMFERLGYPNAKPGDTVTVHFRRNMQETYQEKQFVISGITKSLQEEQENQSYTAYVSRACYEALYAPDERVYNIYFTLADSVPVNSSDLEMTIKDMAEACGINPEYAAENTYFSMWVLDPGMEMITGCVAVALVVVFFAVLVIYNIYQVGLVQKIQEYGKIRALGATKRQMKKLVFREGMMLTVVGVPAGLVVGTAVSVIFQNFWLAQSEVFGSGEAVQVNMVSIPLLLACAAAAVLTVWIALKRPMKLISRISPVEAVRFQGEKKKNRGFRRGRKQVGVLNREQFEDDAYQGSLKGEVDYDQAAKNGDILYGWSYFIEETGYDLGETVTMTVGDAGGETQFQGVMSGAFGSTNYDWILTDQTYEELGLSGKSIGTIWIDCAPQDCEAVRSELEELLTDKQHYEMTSYQGALATSESTLGSFETLAYGVLLLVGLIAFMNMANTMIISVVTRKRELGVMQALGMTNRQMNRMLRNEGLIFTFGSILISLLVGMPAGYALFCYGREHGYFGLEVYHVPFAEILAMVLILGVLQISLSYILSRNVKRESVMERIRYQE